MPSLNDRIAAAVTKVFGSMWTAYAFAAYGVLGAVFPDVQAALLYWSNWIQLWSLPVIVVGTAVLTRKSSEKALQQAQETHDAVMEELRLLHAKFDAANDDKPTGGMCTQG